MCRELLGGGEFRPSQNDYDWLGHGVYFWEANPARARAWARARHGAEGVAVGAVIELGNCLDLIAEEGIQAVQTAHAGLKRILEQAGQPLPQNRGGADHLRRSLDCAVLEYLHKVREEEGLPAYDTVRGLFREGEPIYPGAGFFAGSHLQVCVRNPTCIKGVFRLKTG